MAALTPRVCRDSPVLGGRRCYAGVSSVLALDIPVSALAGTEPPLAKPPSVPALITGRLLSFYRRRESIP